MNFRRLLSKLLATFNREVPAFTANQKISEIINVSHMSMILLCLEIIFIFKCHSKEVTLRLEVRIVH